MTKAKSVIHVVGIECPPETEEKFNKWYSEKHVPDLLKFKKLKKVTRYKNLHPDEKYPKFLTILEFENRQDFEEYSVNPDRTAAHQEASKIRKECGYSAKWVTDYEVTETWQR